MTIRASPKRNCQWRRLLELDTGVRYRDADGRPVSVAFVGEDGRVVGADEVAVSRR